MDGWAKVFTYEIPETCLTMRLTRAEAAQFLVRDPTTGMRRPLTNRDGKSKVMAPYGRQAKTEDLEKWGLSSELLKNRSWIDQKTTLKALREGWERAVNRTIEWLINHGFLDADKAAAMRVDHRSYADQDAHYAPELRRKSMVHLGILGTQIRPKVEALIERLDRGEITQTDADAELGALGRPKAVHRVVHNMRVRAHNAEVMERRAQMGREAAAAAEPVCDMELAVESDAAPVECAIASIEPVNVAGESVELIEPANTLVELSEAAVELGDVVIEPESVDFQGAGAEASGAEAHVAAAPETAEGMVVAEASFPEAEVERTRRSLYPDPQLGTPDWVHARLQREAKNAWIASETGSALDQRGRLLARLWAERGLQQDMNDLRRDLFTRLNLKGGEMELQRRMRVINTFGEARDPNAEVTYDVLIARRLLQEPEVVAELARSETRRGESAPKWHEGVSESSAPMEPVDTAPTLWTAAELEEPCFLSEPAPVPEVSRAGFSVHRIGSIVRQGQGREQRREPAPEPTPTRRAVENKPVRPLSKAEPGSMSQMAAGVTAPRKPSVLGPFYDYWTQGRGTTEVAGVTRRAGEVVVETGPGKGHQEQMRLC